VLQFISSVSNMKVTCEKVVTVPYNTLLHKSTRESVDINIKGNIVIIDEAHNLIDAINTMYSVQMNLMQLEFAHSQLSQYEEKYRNRLKAKNIHHMYEGLYLSMKLQTISLPLK
jgi:chromosome transmission fidelity protein 1